MNQECIDFNHSHNFVEIFEKFDRAEIFVVTGYGINWRALGTVDIVTTKFFINELNEAIELVRKLTKELEVKK